LPNQKELTSIVAQIVDQEYQLILEKTSEDFQQETQPLIVRTLWDSPNHDRYGEYYGIPTTKWAPNFNGRMPPEIVIFARPLIEHYGEDPLKLKNKIHIVVLHEIGHHWGLSEKELRKRGIY